MPLKTLEDQLSRLLEEPKVPTARALSRLEDVKRSKERNIVLYTINDLDKIILDEYYPGKIRYVVTNTFKLVLAREGRPSKCIPQHREMPRAEECIAAGHIILSDETPKKIIGINHRSGDYQLDMGSLLWPLTILNLHSTLIHPDFEIEILHRDDLQKITSETLRISANALNNLLNGVWARCNTRDDNLMQRIIAADLTAKQERIIVLREPRHIGLFGGKTGYNGPEFVEWCSETATTSRDLSCGTKRNFSLDDNLMQCIIAADLTAKEERIIALREPRHIGLFGGKTGYNGPEFVGWCSETATNSRDLSRGTKRNSSLFSAHTDGPPTPPPPTTPDRSAGGSVGDDVCVEKTPQRR